jgi:hypothetical protein
MNLSKSVKEHPNWLSLILILTFVGAMPARGAGDELKYIHSPGGGEIVCGSVTGQSTLSGAMGFMLKKIHGHFGDRPQVGAFFRAKGSSDTIATSFTLTAKNEGNKAIAGLVIVSMPSGQQPSAAVLYDYADRFKSTANSMMKKLNEVWSADAPHEAKGAGSAGQVPPLHRAGFPDNSGSVGLPDGWRITSGQQGTMTAAGPSGETLFIGTYIPVMDPTNPQQAQLIQMETQGGRVPLAGMYVAAPYGMDPFKLLVAISAQLFAKQHKPPASIQLIEAKDQGNGCTLFTTHIDSHDGKGTLYSSIYMCVLKPFMPGSYGVTMNQVLMPEQIAERELPTIRAIIQSYKTNDAVINAETKQNIDNIHAIGERAKIQRDASNAAWDIHQQAYYSQQDSQDKRNQAFSNYQLDKSVVQDNERNTRGTMSNSYADLLVKGDPNRFQYVSTQDFLKGIDY